MLIKLHQPIQIWFDFLLYICYLVVLPAKHGTPGYSNPTINLLDSKYGKAAYFAPSYAYENLVSIARLRLGRRVWERKLRRGPRGEPGIYGQQYYLQLEDDYTEYTDNKTREKRSYYRHGLLNRPPRSTNR